MHYAVNEKQERCGMGAHMHGVQPGFLVLWYNQLVPHAWGERSESKPYDK